MADLVITPPPPNVLTINPGATPSAGSTAVVVDSSRGGAKGDPGDSTIEWVLDGDLVVESGVKKWRFPVNARLLGVSATLSSAAQGADVIVDLRLNGGSAFSTPGDRLVIPAGQVLAPEVSGFVTPTVTAGDYLTVNIDQIGSTIKGADLVVIVRYRRA